MSLDTLASSDRDVQTRADTLSRRWIVIALAYFVAAVTLGVVMGASHDFRLKTVHVHANLLGWVSMALMGVVYRLFPKAAASRLATWHFGLYQAGLPLMLGGLAAVMLGQGAAEPVIGVGSFVLLAAVVCFALTIGLNGRGSADPVGQTRVVA